MYFLRHSLTHSLTQRVVSNMNHAKRMQYCVDNSRLRGYSMVWTSMGRGLNKPTNCITLVHERKLAEYT